MPRPDIAPPPAEAARQREQGAQLASELAPHVARLHDALQRARNRGAPVLKVSAEDLAALFTFVRLAGAATVGIDTVRRLPWWKRLLHALRDERPAETL